MDPTPWIITDIIKKNSGGGTFKSELTQGGSGGRLGKWSKFKPIGTSSYCALKGILGGRLGTRQGGMIQGGEKQGEHDMIFKSQEY